MKMAVLALMVLFQAPGWVQAYAPGQSGVGEGNGHSLADNLYHVKARYYDAEAKRFLSADPIGLQGGFNFYLYANANPSFSADPSGLRVELWSHGVLLNSSGAAGGMADRALASPQHGSLRIYPDNPADFSGRSDVALRTDANGNQYFTLSAGPENGLLVARQSRPSDLDNRPNMLRGTIQPPSGVGDTAFINRLVSAQNNYGNNLDYDALPELADGYNSNSYIAGLLNAAGGTPPRLNAAFPGFGEPVPQAQFATRPIVMNNPYGGFYSSLNTQNSVSSINQNK